MNGQFDITGKVDYNGGTLIMEAGADMAKERDYVHEAETAKARGETTMGIKIKKQMLEDFKAKCAANNTTRNAVLNAFIAQYTYDQ